MATAYRYIRVSTQGQKNDGVYGYRTDREGLMGAIANAKRGDAVAVYPSPDLPVTPATPLELAEMLDKKGVDLVSLSEKIDTTSATGKMVFRMMAILSEFERD